MLDVVTAGAQGAVLKADGQVYVFSIVQHIPTIPVTLPGLSDIVAISMSDSHLLALRKDGTLFALGGNQYGQLGNGTTANSDSIVEVIGLKVKLP